MTQMGSESENLSSERYLKQLLETVSHAELGQRVKTFRLQAGLSIRALADLAMLSKTSIVSLEQGKGCRPITLDKICRALKLHVHRLLPIADTPLSLIQDSSQLVVLELDNLTGGPIASPEGQAAVPVNPMSVFDIVPPDSGFISGVVEVSSPTQPRSHYGAEFGYVLSGVLMLNLDGSLHRVSEGQAFYIPDGATHAYAPDESEPARVLLFRLTNSVP